MSSDSRWSGGAANREWQRGTRPGQPVDTDAIAVQVRRYLRDCAAAPWLDGRYHPTEDGALKVVFHRGREQETAVRAAFRHLTGRPG
jgi:hypothetical protein